MSAIKSAEARANKSVVALSVSALAMLGSVCDANAQAAASDSSDEIVVTARKREERLQDVPVAVTAVSADTLRAAGAADTQDLARLSPGLFYSSFAPSVPNLYIRGVGTRAFDAGAEASIGTFIDGVYIARFASQIQDLADVERVEVLRGPQGALFGRNTIGGAINVVTREPGDDFEADLRASYGQSSHFDGEEASFSGLVGGPLVENQLYGQLSYSLRDTDGATRDVGSDSLYNGGKNEAARGRLVLRPGGDLEFDLSADMFRTSDSTWVWSSNTVGGARPNVLFAAVPGPAQSVDPYVTSLTAGQGGVARDGWGANATINDTFGAINFTSISGYRESQNGFANDLDGTSLDSALNTSTEEASQFSQEFRLASTPDALLTFGGRVNWLIGAYYFEEDIDRVDAIVLGADSILPGDTITYGTQVSTESWALFGQVGIALTDRLNLDLSIRTSEDSKDGLLFDTETIPAFSVPFSINLSDSWSSTNPSVALSYRFTPDVMAFASYASGFKSGGFQWFASDPVSASDVVRPEEVDAYQLGLRADWLDRRLRTNVTLFHYDYADIQVPRIEGITAHTSNAAQSTVEGVEIEGFARFTDNLRLDYGYSYLDAHYDDYVFDVATDFSGNRLPRSPEQTFNAALVFEVPTSLGDFSARISGNYVGDYYFEPDNAELDPGTHEPEHTFFDASVGLTRGAYSITLWGKNLSDEESRSTVLNFGNGSVLFSTNRVLEIWAPRRTIGLTLGAHW